MNLMHCTLFREFVLQNNLRDVKSWVIEGLKNATWYIAIRYGRLLAEVR